MIYSIKLEDYSKIDLIAEYLEKFGDFTAHDKEIYFHTDRDKKNVKLKLSKLLPKNFTFIIVEINTNAIYGNSYPKIVEKWAGQDFLKNNSDKIKKYEDVALDILHEVLDKILEGRTVDSGREREQL